MHPRFRSCILILFILVLTLPVLATAAPAINNARTALTAAPTTIATAAPVTTVTCTAPCQCLLDSEAVALWGTGGYTQCAEHPCQVSQLPSGATVGKYCFKPNQAAAPASTTPLPVGISRVRITPPVTTTLLPVSIPPKAAVTTPVYAPPNTICGVGLTRCDGACVNMAADPLNCGSCGYQCSSGEPCTGGSCGTGCPAGLTECRSGECLNLQNDGNNCGDCGVMCGENQYCTQGKCINSPTIVAPGNKYFIDTLLETDSFDNNLNTGSSSGGVLLFRNWADYTTLTISKETKDANHVGNFRFNSSEKNVRMFLWQVSRYPFADDPHHWQPKYIPGLVAYGPVELLHGGFAVNALSPLEPGETYATYDIDGFQYFRINFTRIAGRNPGFLPYFDGTVQLIPAGSTGKVRVADVTRLPFNAGGVTTSAVNISSFSLVVPTGYVTIPPGAFTESEMGNPTEGMFLTCTDCGGLRSPSPLESSITDGDQKFYVRLVPIHNDGTAGIPSVPVSVTVTRPRPCPTGLGAAVPISPPSVKVLSFTPTVIIPQVPGNVQYFVSIMDPAYCAGKHKLKTGTETGQDALGYEWGSPCDAFFEMYHGQVGWHRGGYVAWHFEPESDWWDFMPDFIIDIINSLDKVYNKISQTWNEAQALAAKLTAKGWSFLITMGVYRCDLDDNCLDMVLSGQSAAIAAVGVPPTLPTYDEMADAGEEYLIQVSAEELGAGEIYDNIPPEVKEKIRSNTKHYAKELVDGQTSSRKNQLAQASGWAMLDPLVYSPHSAIVIVRVYNPAENPQSTSRVMIKVRDSAGLYEPVSKYVPALAPGEGIAIPVSLPEDYAPFKGDTGCPDDENRNHCIMGKWLVHRNEISADTFDVSVQYKGANGGTGLDANKDALTLDNLGPDSSGKKLSGFLQMDPGTPNCPATPTVITYPAGWTMKITSKTLDPNLNDPDFLSDGVNGEGTIRTNCTLPEVC